MTKGINRWVTMTKGAARMRNLTKRREGVMAADKRRAAKRARREAKVQLAKGGDVRCSRPLGSRDVL